MFCGIDEPVKKLYSWNDWLLCFSNFFTKKNSSLWRR